MIFNYNKSSWTDNSKTVLISYTNGDSLIMDGGISLFSNTEALSAIPNQLFSKVGNTSIYKHLINFISYF